MNHVRVGDQQSSYWMLRGTGFGTALHPGFLRTTLKRLMELPSTRISDPAPTAARLRETIVISDIRSDFRWPEYRALALENGLRASWSTPIPSLKGEVMGSFDMYSREPRAPDARELDIIKQMTHH